MKLPKMGYSRTMTPTFASSSSCCCCCGNPRLVIDDHLPGDRVVVVRRLDHPLVVVVVDTHGASRSRHVAVKVPSWFFWNVVPTTCIYMFSGVNYSAVRSCIDGTERSIIIDRTWRCAFLFVWGGWQIIPASNHARVHRPKESYRYLA